MNRILTTFAWAGPVATLLLATLIGGCNGSLVQEPVPKPIDLLLPHKIRLHPFTGTRVFGAGGGITGIDVRIEAIDAFDDATKAFGQFRFELYSYDPNRADHKGRQLLAWPVDVENPDVNRIHWNSITRTYQFKLKWEDPIPVGQKFVLRAMFQSRFAPRVFDERLFVSGQ